MMLNGHFTEQGRVSSSAAHSTLGNFEGKEQGAVAGSAGISTFCTNKSVVSHGSVVYYPNEEPRPSTPRESSIALPQEIIVASDSNLCGAVSLTSATEKDRKRLMPLAIVNCKAEEAGKQDTACFKAQHSMKRYRSSADTTTSSTCSKKARTKCDHEESSVRVEAVTSKATASLRDEKASAENQESSSEKDQSAATSSPALGHKKKYKKPKDMPRRPLSAYNIFFREERARILPDLMRGSQQSHASLQVGEEEQFGSTSKKAIEVQAQPGLFSKLGKTIGARWSSLPPSQKEKYQRLAAKEMSRYRMEMIEYNARQSAKAFKNEESALHDPPTYESLQKNETSHKTHHLGADKAESQERQTDPPTHDTCDPKTTIDMTTTMAATNARVQTSVLNLLNAQQNTVNMASLLQHIYGGEQQAMASSGVLNLLESLAKSNTNTSLSRSPPSLEAMISAYSTNTTLPQLSVPLTSLPLTQLQRAIVHQQNLVPSVASLLPQSQPSLDSKIIDPLTQLRLASIAAAEARSSYVGQINRAIEEQRHAQRSVEQLICDFSAQKERDLILRANLILQERVRQQANKSFLPGGL